MSAKTSPRGKVSSYFDEGGRTGTLGRIEKEVEETKSRIEFLEDCFVERQNMGCVQSRLVLTGHVGGIRSLSVVVDGSGRAEMATAGTDQQIGLFQFQVPATSDVQRWDKNSLKKEVMMGQ